MSFSFSFSGDDIDTELEDAGPQEQRPALQQHHKHVTEDAATSLPVASHSKPSSFSSAFPVQGKPQLPPTHHDLGHMLSRLPSKIAYGVLEVELDDGAGLVRLPRRELWDVRVQLAAEDDDLENGKNGEEEADNEKDKDDSGLGKHDVRSGIYEGGFKSWESSVDLVKVLSKDDFSPAVARTRGPVRMIELGCGTALPSLAVFQWASSSPSSESVGYSPLLLTLADYNPSVLYLVTLPNFILSWAIQHQSGSQLLQEALSSCEGELELSDDVKAAFQAHLQESRICLSFFSGGWSAEFVELLYSSGDASGSGNGYHDYRTVVVGAETIYSPFALASFSETLLSVLRKERDERPTYGATSIVAAKRLYFGVGGSLDDFIDRMTAEGAVVRGLREETEGVRRGVVQCSLPQTGNL